VMLPWFGLLMVCVALRLTAVTTPFIGSRSFSNAS
jgi:hypothetical protein